MLFTEMIAVYSGNHKKAINTICRQNAELLDLKGGGIWILLCLKELNLYRQANRNYWLITIQVRGMLLCIMPTSEL
jgi:hypothetical protein